MTETVNYRDICMIKASSSRAVLEITAATTRHVNHEAVFVQVRDDAGDQAVMWLTETEAVAALEAIAQALCVYRDYRSTR